jgi:hypothetical protein
MINLELIYLPMVIITQHLTTRIRGFLMQQCRKTEPYTTAADRFRPSSGNANKLVYLYQSDN